MHCLLVEQEWSKPDAAMSSCELSDKETCIQRGRRMFAGVCTGLVLYLESVPADRGNITKTTQNMHDRQH